MRHIYTDRETDNWIEDIKKVDPHFNLSNFLKIAIKQYLQNQDKSMEMEAKLKLLQAQEDRVRAEREYLQNTLIEERTKKMKEEQEREQLRKETIEQYCDYFEKHVQRFIKQSLVEDIPHPVISQLAEEWAMQQEKVGAKKNAPILTFLESKNYKRVADLQEADL